MKTTLRLMMAAVFALTLIFPALPFATPTTNADVAPTMDTDIDDGARQFDEAVKDVETILSLDLSNEAGARQADKILRRNEKKLEHYQNKALQAALRSAAFEKGIKQEAAIRKGGAEELARELESNPNAVGTIPGAEEAAEAIKNSTKDGAQKLKRIAEALQKAADTAKNNHAPVNQHHARLKIDDSSNHESSASPELFCSAYPQICIVLTMVSRYYLRTLLSKAQSVGSKAICVTNSYRTYQACAAERWWDVLYCGSKMADRISDCLKYA